MCSKYEKNNEVRPSYSLPQLFILLVFLSFSKCSKFFNRVIQFLGLCGQNGQRCGQNGQKTLTQPTFIEIYIYYRVKDIGVAVLSIKGREFYQNLKLRFPYKEYEYVKNCKNKY